MIECIRRDVQHRMNEIRKVLADSGVETEGRMIEDGFPSLEILNSLQTYKNPLFVMGTHAIGGIERFVLGSTAEEVFEVSVVSSHYSRTARHFRRRNWSQLS